MLNKCVQNDGKKKEESVREPENAERKKRVRLFPLSQGRPLKLCSLLLPHPLSSAAARSRQRC